MDTPTTLTRPREWWQPIERESDSSFNCYCRISPVALIYGNGTRYHVSEHNAAHRLLTELYRLGRDKVPIRGMISEHGAVTRESLRALNCYLEHYYGQTPLAKRAALHRHSWIDLQRAVGLRWQR